MRWKEIKRLFARDYLQQIGPGEYRNESRQKRGEAAIWQRRFWEHTLRDEADLNRHLDTIHYNPVKHGLVKRVTDWPWSSFHRYVRMGYYTPDWGEVMEVKLMLCEGWSEPEWWVEDAPCALVPRTPPRMASAATKIKAVYRNQDKLSPKCDQVVAQDGPLPLKSNPRKRRTAGFGRGYYYFPVGNSRESRLSSSGPTRSISQPKPTSSKGEKTIVQGT